jgi:uncharacterized membrane protein YjgN (DUF898 family)
MEETITLEEKKPVNYELKFFGNGREYFSILIINWLLTIITLGIYYPWARARKLQYIFGATALNDDRFAFHGTGKEMFRGFIKVILFYIVLITLLYSAVILSNGGQNMTIYWTGFLLFYALFFAVLPLMIHGAYRYRMSRTSWRGIRFGYRGNKKELYGKFLGWLGLTIITFGIYSPWMEINLRKYLVGNVRGGDAEFKYSGNGGELFLIYLVGYFATIFTFGIYSFWWQKNLYNYYIDNISIHKDDNYIRAKSKVTGGGILKLTLVNLLITIFTFGLGYAWVEIRTKKYYTENIMLTGDIDPDSLQQTEDIYTDATGEDATDFFDIDIF